MKIKFHGAAGMVTGSCYELTPKEGKPILIDFGMFQGPEEINKLNREALQFEPASLDGVILTHAHLDHCGRLPLLVKHGFSAPIYMTEATRTLLELVLRDSAHIAERGEDEPIYATREVEQLLSHTKTVDYHEQFSFRDFRAEFYDAGHILGSASVLIQAKEGQKIVFSGDLGNSPQDIERETELFDNAGFAVMESTYGDKTHPPQDAKDILMREIQTVEKTGGTLLIPAFSLERTQVILHYIDHLKKDGQVALETPVFLDSPMGIAATDIYKEFSNLYNETFADHARKDDPFDFSGLKIIQQSGASKRIKNKKEAKVVIAGSGMMNGGRILNHAIDFLPRANTRLLVVGYQAVETIGREILEGAKNISIYGKNVKVKATVTEISSMSAHADQPRLIKWIKRPRGVKKIFLTHGEDPQRQALAAKIRKETDINEVYLPKLYDKLGL